MTVYRGQIDASPPGADAFAGRSTQLAGQLDAELFLSVSARLKGAYSGLTAARLSESRRARWQNRLIDISNAAKQDLSGAAQQLDRFEDEFRRETAA